MLELPFRRSWRSEDSFSLLLLADGWLSDGVEEMRSRESWDSAVLFWVCIEGVSRDLRDSAEEGGLGAEWSSAEVGVSVAFSFDLAFSALEARERKPRLNVGAAGLSRGVIGLWDEGGRVPITPTGGGLD